MRKKVLNIFILIVTLFLFNFDGVMAESSTLTCTYSSADGKNAAKVTYDFGKENKRRVVITKYNGEKRDNNDEDELNDEIYNWVVENKKCPGALGIHHKNANFKTYSGSIEEVEEWNAKNEEVGLMLMKNYSTGKIGDTIASCIYSSTDKKTVATINFNENNALNEALGELYHNILITKYLGVDKNQGEPDLNTSSIDKAISENVCPTHLGLYYNGSYEMYSGSEYEVAQWLIQYEMKKQTRLLLNTDSSLIVGFDGESIDDFISNKVGATNDCSASDENCLNKQKKLLAAGREINKHCKEVYANATIKETDSEYTKCEDFDKKYIEYAKNGYFGKGFIASSTSGCTETLGSLGEWLTKIYKILLLAVPVIIMIFGFKDFMKAILNGKEDELKKAGSTFIKRLIFGAVFVALPIFIKVILSLALGGSFSDICIL